MMDTRDKLTWLEAHGEVYKGKSLDSNNMYFRWISYNDDYSFIEFMPTVDEAVDGVFEQLVDELFILCTP